MNLKRIVDADSVLDVIEGNKEDILKRAGVQYKRIGSASHFGVRDSTVYGIHYLNTADVWQVFMFNIQHSSVPVINDYMYIDLTKYL